MFLTFGSVFDVSGAAMHPPLPAARHYREAGQASRIDWYSPGLETRPSRQNGGHSGALKHPRYHSVYRGVSFLECPHIGPSNDGRKTPVSCSTHREIFSKSCWIKPKSDCIYHFPIDLEYKRTCPFVFLYGHVCFLNQMEFHFVQKIERKTVTTIISHSMWKEMEI